MGAILAKVLDVRLDYLADEGQDGPPREEGLTDDEKMILGIARTIGYDEAILRLTAAPGAFGGVTSDRPKGPREGGSPGREKTRP